MSGIKGWRRRKQRMMECVVTMLEKKNLLTVAAACVAGAMAHAAETNPAADPSRAQLLYENHCSTCHESSIHIRARRSQSREELEGWVRRWRKVLSLEWPEQDVMAVTDYLDRTYYGFDD